MLSEYPIGLHARTECFRCCSTVWNDETKEWILGRMRGSSGNIKPICVVEADESITMYLPNQGLTDLVKTTPTIDQIIMIRKQESVAHWMKERTRIQKSNNLSTTEKEIACKCLEKQDYEHQKLSQSEQAELDILSNKA